MTVIVGLKTQDKVYLGCDSLFSIEDKISSRNATKIIIKSGLVIGMSTTNCRIFQVLEYKLKLPRITNDVTKYMATIFIPKLRRLLQSEGLLLFDEDTKETTLSPAAFLVGVQNKLFDIGEDFDLAEVSTPFESVGISNYALGSLHTTEVLSSVTNLSPEDRLLTALKISEQCSTKVKNPFYIVNTEDLVINKYS